MRFRGAWRQQDFAFFTGPRFKELLRKDDITLVSREAGIAALTPEVERTPKEPSEPPR